MAAVLEQRVQVVEERVDRLEVIFGQFMAQTGMALQRIDRSIERIEAAIVEMKAEAARDREEAARDREETARDREETARGREEAARGREEAARGREEAARGRDEAAKERRAMNRRWGELANKQGTLVEDLIAPSLRRIARDELGCGDVRFFGERVWRTRSDDLSRRREFDALYVGEFAVLLNETKSSPRAEDVRAFVDFLRSGEFALYFPEYRELPVTPVFSSLYLPDDLVIYLSRSGIYAVAMGEETMQVLNREQVRGVAT